MAKAGKGVAPLALARHNYLVQGQRDVKALPIAVGAETLNLLT